MKILHWAITWWYPSVENANTIAEWWFKQVNQWCKDRGSIWAIAHIKAIRLHVTRYICGQPLLIPQGQVALRKDGLPKGIQPLLNVLDTNRGKSFVLTLLMISRCIPGTKAPDLSTITDPWKGYIPYQLQEFIPEFIKLYNLQEFKSTFTLSDLPNSNKSGPIGQTTQTSVLQADFAYKIKEDLINLTGGNPNSFMVNGRLFQPLANIEKPLAKWRLLALRNLVTLALIFKSKSPHLVKYLRKLSIVKDPEAKARIICIFDYWSQAALKGVHNWAFDQLRLIPQDRTFDQNPYMIKKDGPYYSIDLSAATDRFPIKLQQMLFEKLSSPVIAESWKRILTEHEVYVPWNDSTVKYNAGQPMGAYSSWAIFALTHHLTVQYSAKMAGEILPFRDYMLLGDDIVIANKAVSERYLEVMGQLDVGISLHKTHVSDDTYEFAKRWIHRGCEISPIPLRGLISSQKRYNLVTPMIYHILDCMTTQIAINVPRLVEDFYLKLGLPRRQCKAIYNRTEEFTAVWKYVKNGDDSQIFDIIKRRDNHWHPFPNVGTTDAREYLNWLLERTVTREIIQVTEDLENFLTKFHKRFRVILDGLVAHTSLKDDLETSISYHPSWQAVMAELGRVSDRTHVLIKNKEWRELLKVVTIPDPNKIIMDRNNQELSQGVAKFAKSVFKTAAMQRDKDIWFLAQFD